MSVIIINIYKRSLAIREAIKAQQLWAVAPVNQIPKPWLRPRKGRPKQY